MEAEHKEETDPSDRPSTSSSSQWQKLFENKAANNAKKTKQNVKKREKKVAPIRELFI